MIWQDQFIEQSPLETNPNLTYQIGSDFFLLHLERVNVGNDVSKWKYDGLLYLFGIRISPLWD